MPPEITDAILPAQLFFRPKPDAFLPEKRLMVAVLAAAVDDYTTYADAKGGSRRRQFANVEAWFASNSARWPFSFVGICEALDLDVSYLRGGLRQRCRRRRYSRSVSTAPGLSRARSRHGISPRIEIERPT